MFRAIAILIATAAVAVGIPAEPIIEQAKKEGLYKRKIGFSHAQGAIQLPSLQDDLDLTAPISMEVRWSLLGGHDTVSTSTPGLRVTPDFKGPAAVVQLPGHQQKKRSSPNYNHPSGATYRNLVIKAGKHGGMLLGGAQTTTVERVTVVGFGTYGIAVQKASHTFALRDLYLVGGSSAKDRRGTALQLSSTKTTLVSNAKLHRAKVGLRASTIGLQLEAIDIEHVDVPLQLSGALIRGVVRIARSGPQPIDLTGIRECDFSVQITAPDQPGMQTYLDRQGKIRPIGTVSQKGNGGYFRFRCNRDTGYQVEVTPL